MKFSQTNKDIITVIILIIIALLMDNIINF
jgi:hypothetical protein